MLNLLPNNSFRVFCLTACLLATACGPDVKTLEIQTATTKITVQEPVAPRELVMLPINVNVITKENFKELDAQLKSDPKSVFLVLSPNDYESLATNIAELRRYISQQGAIVQYYRDTVKTLSQGSDAGKDTAKTQ